MTYLSMKFLTIFMLFLIIIVMEFSTPNDYVFGYLYTGAILLASFWFGRIATIQTTFMSVFLTILNPWRGRNAGLRQAHERHGVCHGEEASCAQNAGDAQ